MTPSAHLRTGLAALCALLALRAGAGVVSVTARSASGSMAEDVVVVFDPLDATPPPAHPAAIIDQVNKTYVPHVSVVRTGTTITFPNSDRIHHQVYSFSPAKRSSWTCTRVRPIHGCCSTSPGSSSSAATSTTGCWPS